MDEKNCIIYYIIIILLLTNTGGVLAQNEPSNIERREGEMGVRISCEIFTFEERVPFWRINGIDYISCNLPPPYIQTSSGLDIEIVTRDMDGTTFQCLLPSQNDLSIQATRIGTLTVIGNGTSSGPFEENYLELDHQNIDLNEENITFAWRFSISNQTCNMISITSTSLCDMATLQKNSTAIEERTFTLPADFRLSDIGQPLSFIDISVHVQNELQDVCPGLTLKEPIQFDIDEIEVVEIPLESGSCNYHCINISSSTFILAISNTPKDIFCPIYIEEGSNCFNSSRCFGYADAYGSPFFNICKNALDGSFQMCFMNTSQVLDNLKMFFLISSRPCPRSPLSTKLYTRAIQIQVKDCVGGFAQEPEDITATDGDKYFLIACRTCGNESRSPSWRINGFEYTQMGLPVFYVPSPSGLFIDMVDVSMNGTTFQCILPAMNDSPMQISCQGVLTVEAATGAGFEEVLALDLSVLDINTENVTLTWRGSYNIVCNFSYVLIEWSSISECDSSLFTLYNTSDSSVELPRLTSTGREAKFIISVHECSSLLMNEIGPVSFTFDHFETAMVPYGYDRCSCINVSNTFKLITSTRYGDAECTVLILQTNDDCFDVMTNCRDFIDAISNTTKTFFSVCRDHIDRSRLQMCFGNITEKMNGTKMYLTSSTSKCGKFVRRYNQGISIQLQAFNVKMNPESEEICIYPPSSLNCATIPEENFVHVTVRDISQYFVFSDDITIGTCAYVWTLQLSFCAPFLVTLNDVESNYDSQDVNDPEPNLCKCLEENVKLKFEKPSISREMSGLVIGYYCNTVYVPAADVELNVTLSVGLITHWITECENGTILMKINSICTRSNELVYIFVTKTLGGRCYNDSIDPIAVKCPDNSHHLQFLWFLVVPVLLLVFVAGAIIYWCKRNHRCCFSPDEDGEPRMEMEERQGEPDSQPIPVVTDQQQGEQFQPGNGHRNDEDEVPRMEIEEHERESEQPIPLVIGQQQVEQFQPGNGHQNERDLVRADSVELQDSSDKDLTGAQGNEQAPKTINNSVSPADSQAEMQYTDQPGISQILTEEVSDNNDQSKKVGKEHDVNSKQPCEHIDQQKEQQEATNKSVTSYPT